MRDERDLAMPEELRQAFEEAVDEVGSVAVAHLRIAYPAALAAVPKSAQTSLRNAVRAAARSRFASLVSGGE